VDFHNVEQVRENHFYDEVLEELKINASTTATNDDTKALKNQDEIPYSSTSKNFLRMFSLCQASIQQILHGTANPRVRPVMLDVHLPGHFWSTIVKMRKKNNEPF
jgi:hypothetical protein